MVSYFYNPSHSVIQIMHLKSVQNKKDIPKVIKKVTKKKKNDGITPVTCCDVDSSMEQLYAFLFSCNGSGRKILQLSSMQDTEETSYRYEVLGNLCKSGHMCLCVVKAQSCILGSSTVVLPLQKGEGQVPKLRKAAWGSSQL